MLNFASLFVYCKLVNHKSISIKISHIWISLIAPNYGMSVFHTIMSDQTQLCNGCDGFRDICLRVNYPKQYTLTVHGHWFTFMICHVMFASANGVADGPYLYVSTCAVDVTNTSLFSLILNCYLVSNSIRSHSQLSLRGPTWALLVQHKHCLWCYTVNVSCMLSIAMTHYRMLEPWECFCW